MAPNSKYRYKGFLFPITNKEKLTTEDEIKYRTLFNIITKTFVWDREDEFYTSNEL